jgi:nicotinamidase-related amidase
LIAGAREACIQIVYVPHHHLAQGDLEGWEFPNPTQRGVQRGMIFEEGSWGAEYHPDLQMQSGDLEAQQHWVSSGFANTDLDLLLRSRGIDHVVLAGVRANTCVEATGRYAVELGYHAALIKDAIASFSAEDMRATIEVNFPAFGHAVLSTDEFLAQLQ